MLRALRRKSNFAKVEDLNLEHFTVRKSVCHGFPADSTAVGYDPDVNLMALGTKYGELIVYGRPGVEFRGTLDPTSSITRIFSFGSLYQYITVSADNTVALWKLEGETTATLSVSNTFQLDPDGGKEITECCLVKVFGYFYVGTEGGDVYCMDVRVLELKNDAVINWTNATALIQGSVKISPGRVCSLKLCPTDPQKLLIGYEKGIIALWNIDQGVPERNYPASILDTQQPLESLSWQHEGLKFVSSHADSSIYFWNTASNSPEEGPTRHYGDASEPVTKVLWLNTDSNPLIVFSGGLPSEEASEHHTVTVLQGTEHVALDFSSPVLDFLAVTDNETHRAKSMIVLCEQEILAFDLEAPKCPQIRKPYLYSLHDSPVTCVRVFDCVPKEFSEALQETSLTSPPPMEHFSNAEWPALGGYVRLSDPPNLDILITGHENGSVKFWDVTSAAMHQIGEVKTATIFGSDDQLQAANAQNEMFSEFSWPPYRFVSTYDQFDDDQRFAIKFIDFCPYTKKLCVGGAAGQVITFALNPMPADVLVETATAEIYAPPQPRARRGARGLANANPLEVKSDYISLRAGFQPSFCLQCLPASPITALAFRPSWGLVAAGNSKGFVVANFYVKRIIMMHATVQSDGLGNVGRVQNLRRSIRSSLRRRANSVSTPDDRQRVAASLNLEMGIAGKGGAAHRGRAFSDRLGSPGPESEAVSPSQQGHVSHLTFAETHITTGGPHVGVIASTLGSSVIRYSIEVPKTENIMQFQNRAVPAGKSYALVHAAPIIAVFVLDYHGQPIPTPPEVEQRIVPPPAMEAPHYAVICTQEQIKLVHLPSMRQKRKEKITDTLHDRVAKAWLIKVKVPSAPVGAARDWNNALVLLTAAGHLMTYSLPEIRLTFRVERFISPLDQKALHSLTVSQNGETFHLCSFSELERRLLCSYNFSYHTSLLPSLTPFEGSTAPSESGRSTAATTRASVEPSAAATGSPPPQNIEEIKRDSKAMSPQRGASVSSKKSDKDTRTTPQPSTIPNGEDTSQSNRTSAAGSVQKDPSVEPEQSDLTPADREVLASAAAFKRVHNQRKSSQSSSSSNSSSSDSEDDEDDDEEDIMDGEAQTFGNPMAVDDDGGKELDTIIASSLQQLESARAFYEKMQQHARGKPSGKASSPSDTRQ